MAGTTTQDDPDNLSSEDEQQDRTFYSDDVEATVVAEDTQNDDDLEESVSDQTPITSGEMEIGDMDRGVENNRGSEESEDEEAVAGSDNVV
jgi:hypothetical protein